MANLNSWPIGGDGVEHRSITGSELNDWVARLYSKPAFNTGVLSNVNIDISKLTANLTKKPSDSDFPEGIIHFTGQDSINTLFGFDLIVDATDGTILEITTYQFGGVDLDDPVTEKTYSEDETLISRGFTTVETFKNDDQTETYTYSMLLL